MTHLGGRAVAAALTTVAAVAVLTVTGQPARASAGEAARWSGPSRVFARYSSTMTALSCVTVNDCTAVDDLGNATTYDGSWGATRSADHDLGTLRSVSCPDRGTCVAVGGTRYAVERRGHWTSVRVASSRLASVSCPGAHACVAVGEGGRTLVLTRHGWSRGPRAGHTDLTGVSCWSGTRCLAVARSGATYQMTSGTWHPRRSLPVRLGTVSLSCGAATLCMAATGGDRVFRWDGRRWSKHTFTESTHGAYDGTVSCVGRSFCGWAGGGGGLARWRHGWETPVIRHAFEYTNEAPIIQCPARGRCLAAQRGEPFSTHAAAAVLRAGHWHSATGYRGITPPSPEVSCPTTTFCMEVGGPGAPATYDGSSWSPASTGTTPGTYPSGDVSCPTATFCLSVSAQVGAFAWRSGTWEAVPGLPSQDVWSVDCATPDWCLLVGAFDGGAAEARVWNGTGFDSVPAPAQLSTSDVSCAAVGDCWATGGGEAVSHFDGASWTDPRLFRTATYPGGGISCPTSDFCAVWSASGEVRVLHAGTWGDPVHVGALSTLTCASATSCTGLLAAPRQASVVRYDGSSWTSARALPRGYGVPVVPRVLSVVAQSLSCPTDTDCVMVDRSGSAYRRS